MLFDDVFEEDEGRKDAMALAKTTVFFAVFALPVAWIFFFVANKAYFFNPFAWISVIIHEFGHFLFLVIRGTTYSQVLGGTLLEYLAPILLALFFARQKRTAAIALILIACMGSELYYTAAYMESAGNPTGYAYLSNRPLTRDNHDWNYLLRSWGRLGEEREIASKMRAFGDALMLSGLAGAAIGYYLLFKKRPGGLFFLLALGGAFALLFFTIKWQAAQMIYSICIFAPSAIIVLAWKHLSKKGFFGMEKNEKRHGLH
ncbi:MAG: hypothetical protein ABH863_00870 [Candidatus Micrarchaeota archaeon]